MAVMEKKTIIITIICSVIIMAEIIAMESILLWKNKSTTYKNDGTWAITFYLEGKEKIEKNIVYGHKAHTQATLSNEERPKYKYVDCYKIKFIKKKEVTPYYYGRYHLTIEFAEVIRKFDAYEYVCAECIEYPNNPKNNTLIIWYSTTPVEE